MNKLVIAITGASGAIYAQLLLNDLIKYNKIFSEVGIILSATAIQVCKEELNVDFLSNLPYKIWSNNDFTAPFASGSGRYSAMVIIPCSMGTIGRIANGISNDLISRAADVMLKENKKLILVPRETPYNLIHLQNLNTLAKSGAIICPASPSFYSKPQNINDLVYTVVNRILSLLGIDKLQYQWGEEQKNIFS